MIQTESISKAARREDWTWYDVSLRHEITSGEKFLNGSAIPDTDCFILKATWKKPDTAADCWIKDYNTKEEAEKEFQKMVKKLDKKLFKQ